MCVTVTKENIMLSEQERAAYIAGDVHTAELLAQVDDLSKDNIGLEKDLEEAQEESLAAWNRENGDAEKYCEFFHDCFKMLDGHYPAPDVDNEHDCQVIFDAIERGEEK